MSAAAFDYSGLLATADRLIARFGRPFRLERSSRATTATADPAKPWISTAKGDADPAAAGPQSITLQGVGPLLDKANSPGTTVERKVQVVFVQASSELPEEVGTDWRLVDPADGRNWSLTDVRPVQPGPTLLLYRLEVGL